MTSLPKKSASAPEALLTLQLTHIHTTAAHALCRSWLLYIIRPYSSACVCVQGSSIVPPILTRILNTVLLSRIRILVPVPRRKTLRRFFPLRIVLQNACRYLDRVSPPQSLFLLSIKSRIKRCKVNRNASSDSKRRTHMHLCRAPLSLIFPFFLFLLSFLLQSKDVRSAMQ
jgi:hypothetical protein